MTASPAHDPFDAKLPDLTWRASFWVIVLHVSSLAGQGPFFQADFDSGLPPEFSSGHSQLEPVLGYDGVGVSERQFRGMFLRNDTPSPQAPTRLSLAGLPPHTHLRIGFLLAVIDTWDGDKSLPGAATPDRFNVSVDGVVVFSESMSNYRDEVHQTYSPPPAVLLIPRPFPELGWQNRPGDPPDFGDAAYDMHAEPILRAIPHTASTATIEWFADGSGWTGGIDESWAIDQVVVDACDILRVDSISPGSGPYSGGNFVIFKGCGFESTANFVFFDGVLSPSVQVVDDSEIHVEAPRYPRPGPFFSPFTGLAWLPPTPVDVVVMNDNGSQRLLRAYTYQAMR